MGAYAARMTRARAPSSHLGDVEQMAAAGRPRLRDVAALPQEQLSDGARVLLVDDEPAIHDIMGRLFKSVNVLGLHALNGKEALDVLRNHQVHVINGPYGAPVSEELSLEVFDFE